MSTIELQITNYYNNLLVSDLKYENWKFHHFRFKLNSGYFIRVKDIINNSQILLNILRKKSPLHAYYTPNKWLNPIYVSKSKNELDILLSDKLYFDIDMKHLNNSTFQGAKDECNKIISFFEHEYAILPEKIVYSGNQGFHLYFENPLRSNITNLHPIERIKVFKKDRYIIIEQLKQKSIIADYQVTMDPYRILRLPNSIHGGTGFKVMIVSDLNDFNQKKSWVFSKMFYRKFLGSKLKEII